MNKYLKKVVIDPNDPTTLPEKEGYYFTERIDNIYPLKTWIGVAKWSNNPKLWNKVKWWLKPCDNEIEAKDAEIKEWKFQINLSNIYINDLKAEIAELKAKQAEIWHEGHYASEYDENPYRH